MNRKSKDIKGSKKEPPKRVQAVLDQMKDIGGCTLTYEGQVPEGHKIVVSYSGETVDVVLPEGEDREICLPHANKGIRCKLDDRGRVRSDVFEYFEIDRKIMAKIEQVFGPLDVNVPSAYYFDTIDAQIKAAQELAEDPNIVRELIDALNSENIYIRTAAAEAIRRMGTSGARLLVESVSMRGDITYAETQRIISEVLANIGDQTVPDLISCLKVDHADVRQRAANALSKIGITAQTFDLTDGYKDNVDKAAEAANKIGTSGCVSLGNKSLKENATKGPKSKTPTVSELIADLSSSDNMTRIDAVKELALRKDPSSVDALIDASNDKYWIIRQFAIRALGNIGDPSAIPTLNNALNDSRAIIRDAAKEALKRIGPVYGCVQEIDPIEAPILEMVSNDKRLDDMQKQKVFNAVLKRKHEVRPDQKNLQDIVAIEADGVLQN
jgi:HEAT repeat protein